MVMSSVLVAPPRSSERAGSTLRAGRSARRVRTAVTSRVYLPACLIALVAAALVGIGWSTHWGGDAFTGSLSSLRVVLVGPLTLAVLGVFLIVERVLAGSAPTALRPRVPP